MTLYQFNALDELTRIEMMVDYGVQVAELQDEKEKKYLVQLDGFYVEVTREMTRGSYQRFRSFSSTSQLKPYLERVDINPILRLL